MGQSINLAIHPSAPPRDVIKLHLDAFDKGIKSLYYQYNLNAAQQRALYNLQVKGDAVESIGSIIVDAAVEI